MTIVSLRKPLIIAGLCGAFFLPSRANAAPDDQGGDMPKTVSMREDTEWCNVWLPKNNATDLPHVLLIGDSIVGGYGPAVEAQMEGRAYVGRLATSYSIGDPALLKEIEVVLLNRSFEVIHFNNGLHGWGYTEEDYKKHFPTLIATLRKNAPHAKLIWATSTPVRNFEKLDEFTELTARVKARNAIAAAVLAKTEIPTDDLFALVEKHPEYHMPDGVHFNESGIKAQAKNVADAIAPLLPVAK